MLPPFVLAADYAGTLELAETSEVRGRATIPGAQTLGFDFYTQPQLRARGTDRRFEYTLSYLPSLTLPDLEQGLTVQILQTGTAGLAWHDRAVRLAVTEDATYGTFNSAYLLSPATSGQAPAGAMGSPALQLVAKPTPITLLTTHTVGTVSVRADRRTSLSADAGYTVSGGLDTDSQNVLPQQRGPNADASLSVALSRRDQVLTGAHAQSSDFSLHTCVVPNPASQTPPATNGTRLSCAPQDRIVQVSQGIVHAIERSTSLGMSAGVSVVWSRLNHEDQYRVAPFPDAGLSLAHRFGERGTSTLQLVAQLAPAADQLTGVVTQRVQGQASVLDRVNEVVTLHASASALHAFSTADAFAATLVGGELELAFLVNRRLRLAVGERGAWQTQDPFGTFFSSLTYFDVTVFAPTLRY